MRIRFWGVRGTIPTPGPDTVKYGGNTACLDILTSNQHVIIIDAGTGIRNLGEKLTQEYPRRVEAHILLSHTHWDHIQGLPFFAPLQSRKNRFDLIGQKRVNVDLEKIISMQFQEPFLPFAYRSLAAGLNVSEVTGGETIFIDDRTSVTVADLNHPGGCLGFRVQDGDKALAYFTDTSWDKDEFDEDILRLVNEADLLIHDTFFAKVEEARTFGDWGHSSWLSATKLAEAANVNALGLFHYAPGLDDQDLEQMREKACEVFLRTFLAREGMTLSLPLDRDLPE